MMVSQEQRSPPATPPPEDVSLGEPQSISQALAQATAAPVESSTPVEMSTLDQRHPIAPEPDISNLPQSSTSTPPTSTTTKKPLPSSHPDPVSQLGPSSSAIQSTQNQTPATVPEPTSDPTKILLITLLLLNGARHPYKIDERYLSRRNVNVDGNNPINMTIYTLKELIWRDWREEWEPRPTSPGMIRLIHAGHMPEDKMRLGGKSPSHPEYQDDWG